MTDVLTKQVARTYDVLRARRSMTSALGLFQATATGYTQVGGDITAGWYAEFTEDRVTGEQSMQVLLAESDEWDTDDLNKKAAAVAFNSLRYKIHGRRKPEGAPLVWVITASATGEAVS